MMDAMFGISRILMIIRQGRLLVVRCSTFGDF